MSNFTNSPLIVYTRISPNRNSPRNQPISKITVHHFASVSTIENIGNWFAQPSTRASYNYGIGNDGRIALYVPERDRCWGSSSAANDNQAVVIGLSNSATGGQWPVSNAAWKSLVRLAVCICRRNNIPRLWFDGTPNGSLTHHSMFSNTICPGPFLLNRFQTLCQEVNRQIEIPGNSTAVFRVQAGAFRERANAEALQRRMWNAGFEAFLVNDNNMFRVQAGSFSIRANAEALLARLHNAGFNDAFINVGHR